MIFPMTNKRDEFLELKLNLEKVLEENIPNWRALTQECILDNQKQDKMCIWL